MDLATILLISIGLSMDVLAVSIATGLESKKLKLDKTILIALLFGSFHAIMLTIGWLFGLNVINLIRSTDHWIAFLLLGFVGVKMIYESKNNEKIELVKKSVLFLLTVSLATSIDAMAVGLSFALLETTILIPVAFVGSTAFFLSFTGFFIGKKAAPIFKDRVNLVGGVILIIIGLKILLEHTLQIQ